MPAIIAAVPARDRRQHPDTTPTARAVNNIVCSACQRPAPVRRPVRAARVSASVALPRLGHVSVSASVAPPRLGHVSAASARQMRTYSVSAAAVVAPLGHPHALRHGGSGMFGIA